MRPILLLPVACLCTTFPHYDKNGTIFGKDLWNIKCVFRTYNFFSNTSHSKQNSAGYCHNVHRSSCQLSVILAKGKAVPLQGWSGPEGSRKLGFPDFMTTAQDGGKVVSLTHRPPFTSRKYTWYPFLLEAESTPGPLCGRKDYVTEKFQ